MLKPAKKAGIRRHHAFGPGAVIGFQIFKHSQANTNKAPWKQAVWRPWQWESGVYHHLRGGENRTDQSGECR